MLKDRLIAIGQTIIIILAMSLGNVLSKRAIAEVPPFTYAWTSIAVGMILLGTYTFVIRREKIPTGLDKKVWFYIILIGVCNFVISRVARPFALERLPATTTVYLGNFVGFATMGLSIFILKERPYVFQFVGAVVAILGLRVFYQEIPPVYELVGILFIIIGIAAIATSNNVARLIPMVTGGNLSNNIISTIALLSGGGLIVAIGLIIDFPPKIPSWQMGGIIVYEGIVRIAIALTVWNYVLRTLRSYEASILGATSIIWTALLAIPILGERLMVNQVIGMAMMLFGITFVQIRKGHFGSLFRRRAEEATADVAADK